MYCCKGSTVSRVVTSFVSKLRGPIHICTVYRVPRPERIKLKLEMGDLMNLQDEIFDGVKRIKVSELISHEYSTIRYLSILKIQFWH